MTSSSPSVKNLGQPAKKVTDSSYSKINIYDFTHTIAYI